MTDKDEPDIQNSGISNEPDTAIQTPISTEDETLLLSDALTGEAIDEPTRKFASPVKETQTKHKTEFEAEPTEVLQDKPQDDDLAELPDENALRPSRLRFALVCLLFVFFVGANVINLVQKFAVTGTQTEFKGIWVKNHQMIFQVEPEFADRIKVGDLIESVNGERVNKRNYYKLMPIKAGEPYTLQFHRDDEAELREVELVTRPIPFAYIVDRYFLGILISSMFLLTGLGVFLLKPNDKQTLLLAVWFAVCMGASMRIQSYLLELPLFFGLWWRAGYVVAAAFFMPLVIHLFLVFPERSRLVRRFPKLEWLVYLPTLLFILPLISLDEFSYEGWTLFDTIEVPVVFSIIFLLIPIIILPVIMLLHFLAFLALMIFNYLKTDKMGKRRIRLIVAGLTFVFSWALVIIIGLVLISLIFEIDQRFLNDWLLIIVSAPNILIPLTFAYAIARHKVIPVSFVIRRGLQYLLAKNALRLLLILPILGIVWNITANPNRTLSEILLNNSFTFYLSIALAVALVLLNRFGLRDWVDRRFFREQYNQEKILRELTETVKESDSLPKLSRLVSSKIQAALHPENVYLFFRDDANQSDFSLGYTTNELSEPPAVAGGLNAEENPPATAGGSDKMMRRAIDKTRLAADSPLLRFMQQERGAVEFPTRQTDDLPNREKRWLRETGANLLVPMHGSDGKLAGIFSLGEKRSQIPYTRRDKELLETLANQIALVHENLGLKDRMRREQKIKTEVLSRFDEGNINLLKECPTCGKCFDRNNERCDREGAELTFSLPVERTIENRYRLENLLGKGAMGAVYKATDLRINRAVAVKILSGAMFGNRNALRRFEREAQTAGKLNHRNIVTVFDYGVLSTEGAFLVMELVKGNTLSGVLKHKGKLDAATVVVWFAQVLNGLETAHKAGIIHRDLKPDNIFVTRSEDETVRLCILDFGLARFNEYEFSDSLSLPGTIMGTLGYMPPEQLRGERTDERSDLFATGVIIYESLHGEKPYAGKTYQEIMQSMSKEITFGKNEPFANFFKRSLSLKPEKRFASASEMKQALLDL